MKRIRRDDEVVVTAGKDKGKRGKVLKILDDNNALVSGIQIVKKHQKPNPNLGIAGGIKCSNPAMWSQKASNPPLKWLFTYSWVGVSIKI